MSKSKMSNDQKVNAKHYTFHSLKRLRNENLSTVPWSAPDNDTQLLKL